MRSAILFSITWIAASAAYSALAADGPEAPTTAPVAAEEEAAYTQALEKRAGDLLDVLKLADLAKAVRVREAVITHYRSLRGLHDARDARIRSLRDQRRSDQAELDERIKVERERAEAAALTLHRRFLDTLSADLSPEQVEQVKDKMTYNKLQVTYRAYLEMLPDLTPEQKQVVFDRLREARDQAAYAGSAEEKSDIFNKFKGRINNYLTGQGYDLKLATKQWAERRKSAK